MRVRDTVVVAIHLHVGVQRTSAPTVGVRTSLAATSRWPGVRAILGGAQKAAVDTARPAGTMGVQQTVTIAIPHRIDPVVVAAPLLRALAEGRTTLFSATSAREGVPTLIGRPNEATATKALGSSVPSPSQSLSE